MSDREMIAALREAANKTPPDKWVRFDASPKDILALCEMAESRWVPVSERLPEDSRNVIICLISTCPFVGHYNHGKKEWRMGTDRKACQGVTHWQPLPSPPPAAPTTEVK